MKKYVIALLIVLLAIYHAFATDGGGEFYRIGPYWDTTNNVIYEGIKAYHYTTGTTNNLNCWGNENLTTACPSPAIDDGGTCDDTANDGFIGPMYCNGIYDMVVCTSSDSDCPTTPLYTETAIRINQASRAFISSDDHGTAYPSASTTNRWQMFVLHDGSNNFTDLGVNEGAAFVSVLPSATDELSVLTTQGDILYRNATVAARLGYGTAGQVLTTQGASANPTWEDAASSTISPLSYTNLVLQTTGNNTATLTADEIIAQDSSGIPTRLASVSTTLNISNQWTANSSVIDGRGIGISDSADTWYYIWIVNGTTGTGIVATTESTLAGALADVGSGYNTYGILVGEFRNNVSSNFESILKKGYISQYTTITANQHPSSTTASVGDPSVPTWVAVAVRATSTASLAPVPPNAKNIRAYFTSDYTANIAKWMVAPNNTYGAVGQFTNPPPVGGSLADNGEYFNFILESDYIYWTLDLSGATGAAIFIHGWED